MCLVSARLPVPATGGLAFWRTIGGDVCLRGGFVLLTPASLRLSPVVVSDPVSSEFAVDLAVLLEEALPGEDPEWLLSSARGPGWRTVVFLAGSPLGSVQVSDASGLAGVGVLARRGGLVSLVAFAVRRDLRSRGLGSEALGFMASLSRSGLFCELSTPDLELSELERSADDDWRRLFFYRRSGGQVLTPVSAWESQGLVVWVPPPSRR